MSLIYSHWPMALYGFPVSHGEPERQAAHVSSPLGKITLHTSLHNTLRLKIHWCVCIDWSDSKQFFIRKSDICITWLCEQTVLFVRGLISKENVWASNLCFCRFLWWGTKWGDYYWVYYMWNYTEREHEGKGKKDDANLLPLTHTNSFLFHMEMFVLSLSELHLPPQTLTHIRRKLCREYEWNWIISSQIMFWCFTHVGVKLKGALCISCMHLSSFEHKPGNL